MADVIHRFEIRVGSGQLVLTDVKKIVRAEAKLDGHIEFWAVVCPGWSKRKLQVEVVGTGMEFSSEWRYECTTGRTDPGGYVWHLVSRYLPTE